MYSRQAMKYTYIQKYKVDYSLVDAETSKESGTPNCSHPVIVSPCSGHPTTWLQQC